MLFVFVDCNVFNFASRCLINFKHVDTQRGMFGQMQTSVESLQKNFGRVHARV